MSEFLALRGLNYPDPVRPGTEKRVEPGETVADLTDAQAEAYLRRGAIAPKE